MSSIKPMDEPSTPVRWALAGTSEFAVEWIGPAIQSSPDASLVAVVSGSLANAEAAATRLGVPTATDDLGALDPDLVDVVHLVTPNHLHAPQAIMALERGLHVVVEKPMALDMTEAVRMADAARLADRRLFVAHCMAWAPPVAAAARAVAAGTVGTPIELRLAAGFDYPDAGYWRQIRTMEQGGGPWMDLGPHAVDAAIRILGPIESVSATTSRLAHGYTAEDTMCVLLRFVSGAVGTITTTFVAGQNELLVQGTAGSLRSRDWLGREFAGDLAFEPVDSDLLHFQDDPRDGHRPIALEPTNVYQHQVADVSSEIRDGAPSTLDLAGSLHVMAVIDAAIRAARTRRTVTVTDPA
ncbi:MAG: Gfo/Idh/MocA family oxidoreductase [Chloroflexi bacterium]|nr:Gfo/Idh/MocA family oxidoreductase [Chloroflexota bacterium]